jgi:uncharacterized protein (TIGR02117 family)
LVLTCGCATPGKRLFPPGQNEPVKIIYLVSHGWHAGIVLRRSDTPKDIWPSGPGFPRGEFLQVGWGDSEYYQIPDPPFAVSLKAALLPTSSVLHIVGFNGPVAGYFVNSEVIRIELSEPGFEKLYRFIATSFARDEAGHMRPLGEGLYGDSRFYQSREVYHLLNTSNVWNARALREAGCPVTLGTLTVDHLMSQARQFGTTVSRNAEHLDD